MSIYEVRIRHIIIIIIRISQNNTAVGAESIMIIGSETRFYLESDIKMMERYISVADYEERKRRPEEPDSVKKSPETSARSRY